MNEYIRLITSVGVTWYIGSDSFGSAGMVNADYTILGEESLQFGIKKEEVPEGSACFSHRFWAWST